MRPSAFYSLATSVSIRPLGGLDRLPAALRERILDAPYAAAARVFDAALAERVDFVVLTGNLCNLHAPDPKAVDFLREQLTRLTDCGIEVYLAGGKNDPPDLWPAALPLPEGVRWFAETVDQFHFRREGETLAVLCGSSRGQEFIDQHEYMRPHEAPLAIAIAGDVAAPNVSRITQRNFNYWALGGRAAASTLAQSPTGIHYAGSTQGLCPTETSAGGCTLVRLEGIDGPRLRRIETDALRYHTERIVLASGNSRDDLEMLLFERLASLSEAAAGRHLLITLEIAAEDQLAAALHASGAIESFLHDLREEFGSRESSVWPVALHVAPPESYPAAWLEEDSVLGEYLRTLEGWSEEEAKGTRGGAATRPDLAALTPQEAAWAGAE